MLKNYLACTANNPTVQYVNHCHMTCQTAQGLYMAFYFWISVKTVKVSQWAEQESVAYGHGIRHGAVLL